MTPTSAATGTTTFRCAGASVRVSTDIPGLLHHTRTILYAYHDDRDDAGTWHVQVTHDPDVPSSDEARISEHEVDIGPQTRAYRHHAGTRNLFWVPARATLLHADPQAQVIQARCARVPAALDWAPRLVRQAMTAQLLAAGMVYAHAAAFTHRGHGVLIAGHRGQGKTTTLLSCLHHLGGHYATNDRLLLHAAGDAVAGYPWPMPLRVGIGTLSALPHLRHLIPEHLRVVPPAQRWTCPTKIVVAPPTVPTLMRPGATVSHSLTVSLMLWPQLHPDRTAVRVERVAPDEVADTLVRTRIFMQDPNRGTSAHANHWLAPAPDDHIAHEHLRHTAAVLATTPCYRVHAGPDPAALAAAVGHLLDYEAPA